MTLFELFFGAGWMSERSALVTTQDHAFVCMVFILTQTKHTVDTVNLFTWGETLERQVLETSQENSGPGRRNAPWNTACP
jgi:hypothetical protein